MSERSSDPRSEPATTGAGAFSSTGPDQTSSGGALLNSKTASLWSKAIVRIRTSETWMFWTKIVMILGGGTLAAIGGAMEAPTAVDGLTWKNILTFGGIGVALIGGVLVAFMERGGADVLDEARDALEMAREFLGQKDRYQSQAAAFEELDNRRRALIQAINLMREVIEQSILAEQATIEAAAKLLLDTASPSLQAAIGLESGELWAFSIFQVQDDGSGPLLKRIAAHRADRLSEQKDPRSWAANEGYVGGAWHNKRDVIIADGSAHEAVAEYPVPPEKRREYDASRYCSMAAIPIRVGADQVWGVVAASSDRVGRFKRDATNHRAQSVDTVRYVATMMALLAATFERRA